MLSDIDKLKNCTDEELAALSKEGNNYAEELLIIRYKNLVRSKSRSYFLVGADNEDIMQEGMIGLFKAIRDYNPDKVASFCAFAEICVVRQIITAIKTATRHKHYPLNSYISLNKPMFDDNVERPFMDNISMKEITDPEELILIKESLEVAKKQIIDKLSDFETAVLQHYLNGSSYHEISEITKKPIKSVDNALQRIKKKLQSCL